MFNAPDIRIALPHEAQPIAAMSRDYIEHGLGWSWTAARVLRSLRDPATNVAVVLKRDAICGFGIMEYGEQDAHLALLAIAPTQRHLGLGASLLGWLEQPAHIAGLTAVRLEARADNRAALAFYQRLGFSESGTVAGYYEGVIDAVKLRKKLSP